MKSILFICTGNIFRSMVAEHALKALLPTHSDYVVGSAGIEVIAPAQPRAGQDRLLAQDGTFPSPQQVHPFVRDCLRRKGVDLSNHVQRKLTQALLDETDIPVAMGLDHREFIRRQFQREALLFNEMCFQTDNGILDLHEAVPDWQTNLDASRDYVLSVIDHIWHAMPIFFAKLPPP